MMSNKYYREWKKNNSSKSYLHKTLDKTLDKIKTEEKAKKIFNQGNYISKYSQLNFLELNKYNNYFPKHIQLAYIDGKYVIIGGNYI